MVKNTTHLCMCIEEAIYNHISWISKHSCSETPFHDTMVIANAGVHTPVNPCIHCMADSLMCFFEINYFPGNIIAIAMTQGYWTSKLGWVWIKMKVLGVRAWSHEFELAFASAHLSQRSWLPRPLYDNMLVVSLILAFSCFRPGWIVDLDLDTASSATLMSFLVVFHGLEESNVCMHLIILPDTKHSHFGGLAGGQAGGVNCMRQWLVLNMLLTMRVILWSCQLTEGFAS